MLSLFVDEVVDAELRIASPSHFSTPVLVSQLSVHFSSVFLLFPYRRQLPGPDTGEVDGYEEAVICSLR